MYSVQAKIFAFCFLIVFLWFFSLEYIRIRRPLFNGSSPGFSVPKGVLCFCFFVSIYYVLSTFVFTNHIIIRDLVDFFRPFLYLFIFVFGVSVVRVLGIRVIYRVLFFVFFVQFFFNLLIFVPGMDGLVKVYRPQDSGLNYIKFSGTFGFSYTYVFYCIFFGIWGFYRYIEDRSSAALLLFFVSLLAIVLSGSRAGLATFAFVFFLLPFMPATNRFGRRVLFRFFLTSFAFLLVSVPYLIQSDFFSELINYGYRLVELGLDDPSARRRVAELEHAVTILENNLLFGAGSSKFYFNEVLGVHLESLYAYHLAKWGVLGLFIYFFHIFYIYFFCRSQLKTFEYSASERSLFSAIMIACISIFIIGFSISPSDSYIGPLWFYFVVGAAYGLRGARDKERYAVYY